MSCTLLGLSDQTSDQGLFSLRGSLLVWTGLFAATGLLSCLFAKVFLLLFPTLSGHTGDDYVFAAVEGLSAGAMLVVLVSQYLPDATQHLGPGSALLVVLGLMLAAT